MHLKHVGVVCALLLIAGAVGPRSAAAQPLDQLGNRASAIGAFVAVADDASAVVWNPAGLINGPIFNILLDFGRSTAAPARLGAGLSAARFGHSLLALGVPPLGLSYSRNRYTQANVPFPSAQFPETGSAGAADSSRESRQVVVRSLLTSHLGVTILQSLADGVTVGATLKLVRGSLQTGSTGVASWDGAFEHAEMLEGDPKMTADLDLGALVSKGRVRAGIVARHLTAPEFEDGGLTALPMMLERHVRAGVAWGDKWPATAKLIVAVDADLTRVRHITGERRDIAAGAERWFRAQRVALRGGLRTSTLGGARPVASAGGSVAIRSGMYVDVSAARGRDNDARWSVAARLMY
jgi:hypothetical protein